MRCEVVAVGSELLLGQIVDTNSSWIGEQLALAGIDSHFQVKVGDNHGRIVAAIRQALDRADAVILCGGLGPTQDDLTREAIAAVMGVRLVRDEAMADKIRGIFASRNREMTQNNLQQADLPEGASHIAQMPGTAPGLVCPLGTKVMYAVPGVPYEMREMMLGTILPDLQRRSGVVATIKSRTLRTWGYAESKLGELLAGRIDALDAIGNPTIAFLASGIEGLKVRITAKGKDAADAARIIAAEEALVRDILGDVVFGTDEETMESVVLGMLKARGLTLAAAEAVTGGLIGTRLTEHLSAVGTFLGSLVSHDDAVSAATFGIPASPIVTEAAAAAMAETARARFGSDIGIAVTGVLGPDEKEGYRPGAVFIAIADAGGVEATLVRLPGDRARIRQYAVINLLDFLRRHLAAGG